MDSGDDGGVLFLEVEVDGRGHRRGFGRGCVDVKAQARVRDGLGGVGAEGGYGDGALVEVREIFCQRLYALGREENQHVVVERLVGREIVRDGAVHYCARVLDLGVVKQFRVRVVVDVGHRQKEVLLLVLEDVGHQVLEFPGLGAENLAFAEYDVFLQVEGDRLRRAEVFHCVGDVDAHLLAQAEEVVDCGLGFEDDGCEVGDGDLLLAELASGKSFDLDEWAENNVQAVFLGQFIVRRFFG